MRYQKVYDMVESGGLISGPSRGCVEPSWVHRRFKAQIQCCDNLRCHAAHGRTYLHVCWNRKNSSQHPKQNLNFESYSSSPKIISCLEDELVGLPNTSVTASDEQTITVRSATDRNRNIRWEQSWRRVQILAENYAEGDIRIGREVNVPLDGQVLALNHYHTSCITRCKHCTW